MSVIAIVLISRIVVTFVVYIIAAHAVTLAVAIAIEYLLKAVKMHLILLYLLLSKLLLTHRVG